MNPTTPGRRWLHAAVTLAALAASSALFAAGKPGQLRIAYTTGNGGPFHLANWHAGHGFEDGDNWLALTCTATRCTLEPATLKVKREGYVGPFDLPEHPRPGQRLSFRLEQPSRARVIAWFQRDGAYPWLKNGPVTTYYPAGHALRSPHSPGTMEGRLALPHGDAVSFVPMVAGPGPYPAGAHPEFRLQLRAQGMRQLLPAAFGPCTTSVSPSQYVLWVGDLDGDGRPDYLISWVANTSHGAPVDLYLSSRAGHGQLVGLAGRYAYPDGGGQC
jgi:hypothetical protein